MRPLLMAATVLASASPVVAQPLPNARPPAAPAPSSGRAPKPLAADVSDVGAGGTVSNGGARLPAPHRVVPSPAELRVRAANRAATLEPASAAYLNAVQVYPYADGSIYHVFTAPGQVTDIALQPGEVLGAVAAGDTVRWVIGDTTSGSGDSKRTHVLAKPFTRELATNLVITTDRRTYHLALTSTARTAMAAVSWTYPQDQLLALKAAAEAAAARQPVATGLQIDQLRFDYVITGDQPAWRPLRAFDDGRQTYIEFPESLAVGEAPPLFLVNAKGTASLVNYRVQGRFYVVDRLFDAAELRLGLKHQDIVRISHVNETDGKRRAS